MKTKKLLNLLAIVAIVAVSCQSREEYFDRETTPGELVTLQLSPVIPGGIEPGGSTPTGIKPLSSGGGGAATLKEDDYALRYILEVWSDDGSTRLDRKVQVADDYSTGVNFDVTLPAATYKFVFWADFVDKNDSYFSDPANNDPADIADLTYVTKNSDGLKNIVWNTSTYGISNNLRDAYYAVETIDLSTPGYEEITLQRPFGKLRILATDLTEAEALYGYQPTYAVLTYTHNTPAFNTTFNAFTGAAETGTLSAAAALTSELIAEASVSVGGQTLNDVHLLAFDYFLVPNAPTAVSFSLQLYNASDAALLAVPKTVSLAPIAANKLTTVIGAMFTTYPIDFQVFIDDAFDNETTPGNIFLLGPAGGESLLLDYDAASSEALTFEWSDAGVAAYDLLLSKSADMSNPVTVAANINGTSKTVTHAELQAVLDDAANGLKRYYENELYWSVKVSANGVMAKARTLNLSGWRKFVDTRGDETMVYDVAVIDNTYYKGIWMAQNLKTKRFLDGSSAENNPHEVQGKRIFEAPSMSEFAYDLTGILAVAPVNNPRNGYYYHPDWWLSNNNDWATMVPAGWKMPTIAHWTELKNALSSAGGIAPVLDPEMSTWDDASWGTWGLYLSFAGVFGGDYPRTYSLDNYLIYLMVQDSGWSMRMFTDLNIQQGYDIAAIRLKYVGDDE
jgi:uncharacterized protein (TIGR02145 family)